MRNVAKLWQTDTFPQLNEKEVYWSKQNLYALQLLDSLTERIVVQGELHFATPLLRHPNSPTMCVTKQSAPPLLLSTEPRLSMNPQLADVHNQEIHKLVKAGFVTKLDVNCSTRCVSYLLTNHCSGSSGEI